MSFRKFVEEQDEEKALLDSGEETKSMEAIRTGMHLRKPGQNEFWDDFVNLISNADAMADLLEIPKDKIASWPSKIKQIREKVLRADGQDRSDRTSLVKTDHEPLSDPNGMDSRDSADTRPSP